MERTVVNTASKTVRPLEGFQSLKPIIEDSSKAFDPHAIETRSNMILTHQYKVMVYRHRPYYLFMTLTFRDTVSFQLRIEYINKFIKYHNKLVIARRCYEDFMEGFAFFERHPSRNFDEKYHVHMLVKSNHRYAGKGFNTHEEKFRKAAGKVLNKSKAVFSDDCIDIQEAGDDGRIEYCFKHIWDGNLDNIKIIGKDGLSDCLQAR
jgi:hypothetical protein